MANVVRKVVFKEHHSGEEKGLYSAVVHYELGGEHAHLEGTERVTTILTDKNGELVYEVSKRLVETLDCEYERIQE